MAAKGGKVALLVVRSLVVPAAPEDADPFEGEGAQDGVVGFAGAALLVVVGVGPVAVHDGLSGPFDEALAQERGCGPPPVRPAFLSALFTHGSHARVFLQRGGSRVAFGEIAEADQ